MLDLPAAPKTYTTMYNDLKGVDFSTDPALVYRKRSPTALNMISDDGGSPRKRPGWEVVLQGKGKKIKNLWSFNYSGEPRMIFQRGTEICRFGEDVVTLLDDGSELPALGFATNKGSEHNFYLIKNSKVYRYTDTKLEEMEPYIPATIISRRPVDGGGEILEDVNLLTPGEENISSETARTKAITRQCR